MVKFFICGDSKSKFDNNIININNNIETLLYSPLYFNNNIVNINGEISVLSQNGIQSNVSLIKYENNLANDSNITNNEFNINSKNQWSTAMICLIQNTNLNGYKINISNNTFQAKNQTQIFNLINIINNTDINEQYVYLNQNNYGIFKKIGFYNNSTVYNVIIDEKEITSATTLE